MPYAEFKLKELGPSPSMFEIKPLFEQRCEKSFAAATDAFHCRGDQYGDSWRDCQHLALRAVIFQMFGLKPTKLQCEAIAAASLVDVKYQRFQGGYDPDHPLDGINYQAYLRDSMEDVYKEAASNASTLQPLNVSNGQFRQT